MTPVIYGATPLARSLPGHLTTTCFGPRSRWLAALPAVRARRKRPCSGPAAKTGDELPPPHELCFPRGPGSSPWRLLGENFAALQQQNRPLMSEMGQLHALPRRSIAVRFTPVGP